MTTQPIDHTAVDSLIDFPLAVTVARGLLRPGPKVDARQAREVVDELRADAVASTGHVQAVTGLRAKPGDGVLVVDRRGWVQANADAFRAILAPAVDQAMKARPGTNPGVLAVGRKATGSEVGALLAFLGSRVLGQYDIAGPSSVTGAGGRLLLVAPNIVQVERDLDVDPSDFRLWVCLHEETHRVQFAACDWLRGHLLESSSALVSDLLGRPGEVVERVSNAARALPDLVRSDGNTSLLDLIQTPEQRRHLAQLTATMSLLEGHADVVMDEAGPEVIGSVKQIRDRFTVRRQGAGALDRLLRRLLGLEAKMRQYRDGAIFVRGVVAEAGMDGFNQVWTSPDALPRPEEILQPRAWVQRVLD
ncbi:MAG: zinc-dependent metalloprotease [Actinomycetales bacterium]